MVIQKIIPEDIDDLTECERTRSKEGCLFGKNWNAYKDELELQQERDP